MSRAIWITGRPGSGQTTPAVHEESLHAGLRLHTPAPDFRSTVEGVLLLARRLHRDAAATVTQAERDVP